MNHARLEIALKLRLRLAAPVVVLRRAEPASASRNHHPHFRSIKSIALQGSDQLVSRQPIHFGGDDIKNSVFQVDHCLAGMVVDDYLSICLFAVTTFDSSKDGLPHIAQP
jgi:hypothetical protein